MNLLRQKIEQEIRERGPIPFSRYMELCLYHRDLGFYSRNVQQFGKAGDFYTSSDVHAVFGRLLARQFDEMWRALNSPANIELLELGPGRGLFAQDVLDWSQKKFPDFFHALRYILVESSPALRERIKETLEIISNPEERTLAISMLSTKRRAATSRPSSSQTNSSMPSQSKSLAQKDLFASTYAMADLPRLGRNHPPRNWNSSIAIQSILNLTNASKCL